MGNETERMVGCYISRSCSIIGTNVFVDGCIDFNQDQFVDFNTFIKSVYKHYGIGFLKFYKMDSLSKLAFLTSEILLMGRSLQQKYRPEDTGIVLINSSSTLETDTRYFHTIEDKSNYFPSPAVFVYTLPNIMVGEIAIRNKIMGENITFVAEKYDPQFLYEYVNLLMSGKIKSCICGWVEFERTGSLYESFIYLVEKDDITNRNIKFEASFLEKNYHDLKV